MSLFTSLDIENAETTAYVHQHICLIFLFVQLPHSIRLVYTKHFGTHEYQTVHTDAGYGVCDYVLKILSDPGSVFVLLDFSLWPLCVFDGKFSAGDLKHSITTDAPLVLVFQRKQCIHPEKDNIL